jgi:hypothetical protein
VLPVLTLVMAALGVTGVTRKCEIRRVAIVELGVPDVLVVHEHDLEVAIRHVRYSTATIMDLGDLNAVVRIEIRGIVLQHEYDDRVTGMIVHGHVLAIIGTRTSRSQTTSGNESENEREGLHR